MRMLVLCVYVHACVVCMSVCVRACVCVCARARTCTCSEMCLEGLTVQLKDSQNVFFFIF